MVSTETTMVTGLEHLNAPTDEIVLNIDSLKKYYAMGGGFAIFGDKQQLKAVDDISFHIRRGETFGLVGESGCGKTTTAKTVLGLESATAGTISFEGQDISTMDRAGKKNFRSNVQAVFQDPWSSLNPRMRVRSIVGEPLEIATSMTKKQIADRVGIMVAGNLVKLFTRDELLEADLESIYVEYVSRLPAVESA